MIRKPMFLVAALAIAPAAPAFAQSDDPTPTLTSEPPPDGDADADVDAPPAPEPVLVDAPAPDPIADGEIVDEADVDEDGDDSFQLHGWVSQGAMVSSGNNYLAHTRRGSLELFDAGINVTKELGADTRAGIQIFAQDIGPIGNYRPIIDWAYVDHRIKPWLGIRAGHFKNPLYLHSEQMDADMTRTAVLMPQAVYDQHFRDVLAAISGVDAYGTVELGGAGSLEYDAYVGTLFIDPHDSTSNYDVENILGGRVIWNTPVPCLRAAAHLQYANFNEKYPLSASEVSAVEMSGAAPDDWDGQMQINYNDWHIAGGALECNTEKLTVTAEVSNWHASLEFAPMLSAPTTYDEIRGYAQAEYRVDDRFSTSVYASVYLDRSGDGTADGEGEHQYDGAASVRYDITPNLLVKAEAHAIDGYGMTEGSLNRGEERTRRWAMFLAKTTLSF